MKEKQIIEDLEEAQYNSNSHILHYIYKTGSKDEEAAILEYYKEIDILLDSSLKKLKDIDIEKCGITITELNAINAVVMSDKELKYYLDWLKINIHDNHYQTNELIEKLGNIRFLKLIIKHKIRRNISMQIQKNHQ